MGCPVCRVVLAPPEVKPSRTDELEAQLSQAQAEIARLDQAVRDGRTVNAVLARELDAARAKLKETV
jgi:septal ring factor EnvC (AmiA/AmiB activator)